MAKNQADIIMNSSKSTNTNIKKKVKNKSNGNLNLKFNLNYNLKKSALVLSSLLLIFTIPGAIVYSKQIGKIETVFT
ncbi:MAG: hypothetical protein AAF378_12650, partial [Cyanobacteria bacterium P01_A01_bin.84]